jgi:hypothetical protein
VYQQGWLANQRPRVRPSPVSELSALRRWGKSNGRPDESCADPADILVGFAVLETPWLIKSLMSQTQGERIRKQHRSGEITGYRRASSSAIRCRKW